MLRSKVALILGGSSPLSAGLALAAAKQDAIVVLVSSAEKEASETMLMLRAEKREGFFFYCDIRQESDIKAIVATIIGKYKRIDIMMHASDFWEEKWDRVQHLKAVMHATKAVMPYMIKSQYGRIVLMPNLIHDLRAVVATQGKPAPDSPQSQYMASKIGLLSFVRAAAMDLAQFGITVNAIEPGLLNPSGIVSSAAALNLTEKPVIPMGRLGRIDEVAIPAIFFASDGASYITGQWISAGGGLGLTTAGPNGSPPVPHGGGSPPNGNGSGNGNGNGNGNGSNGHGHGHGHGHDSNGGNNNAGSAGNGNGNGNGSGSGSDSGGAGSSSSTRGLYVFGGNGAGSAGASQLNVLRSSNTS